MYYQLSRIRNHASIRNNFDIQKKTLKTSGAFFRKLLKDLRVGILLTALQIYVIIGFSKFVDNKRETFICL